MWKPLHAKSLSQSLCLYRFAEHPFDDLHGGPKSGASLWGLNILRQLEEGGGGNFCLPVSVCQFAAKTLMVPVAAAPSAYGSALLLSNLPYVFVARRDASEKNSNGNM